MQTIHETATLTAKGQFTLPKPIRQALGVDVGDKVAFKLHDDGQIRVSRADAEHQDPAITTFLNLLAQDIATGQHVRTLPPDLARALLAHAGHDVNLDESITGDVAL